MRKWEREWRSELDFDEGVGSGSIYQSCCFVLPLGQTTENGESGGVKL